MLKDTGTKIAFLNRANLEFTLDSMRTKFGNDQSKDVITKKTAYLISQIVDGHPLADGNKRTAAFLSELFLRYNGFRLEVTDDEFFSKLMDVASSKISEKDLGNGYMRIPGKIMQKAIKAQTDKKIQELAEDLSKERKKLYNKLAKS